MRAGCGGSLFATPANDADLITCLALNMANVEFEGRTFSTKSIERGQFDTDGMQFYEEIGGDNEFIYFDKQYGIWRIGGSSLNTRNVDCSTVSICG